MIVDGTLFEHSAEEIVNELDVQLRRNYLRPLGKITDSGDNIMICCPYLHGDHYDSNPSAGIKKDTGIFHCFACGKVASITELISNCFGYNDGGMFGWRWLTKNFMSVTVEDRRDLKLDMVRGRKIEKPKYVDEAELDSYRFYHDYMWYRKLTPEIVDRFDIGYDKKTNCLTFPIRDITGNTLFVARRRASKTDKYFNYPSGAEKPLYGIYELSQEPNVSEVIVCESMLDALTCWVYGKYAVALNGLGTNLQFKQLTQLPCRELIIATDNDSAGQSARANIRKNVKRKILRQYILPENRKDINDLSKEEFLGLRKIFL